MYAFWGGKEVWGELETGIDIYTGMYKIYNWLEPTV